MVNQKGSFVAVSTGMLLGGQISVRGKQLIESADVVYCLVTHPVMESWLSQLNPNTVSLQSYYREGKNRRESYDEMIATILTDVKKNKNVCGAFYGHAGVFACVPHEVIQHAQSEGFYAYMEPGVSAEACLYADLGFDPGEVGIQSYEASQFLFYNHFPNNKAYLLLWQIALAGDTSAKTFKPESSKVQLLVEHLLNWYPKDHGVILYEAKVLPVQTPRMEKVALKDLAKQQLNSYTTLVIPPSKELILDKEVFNRINRYDIA